MFLLNSCDRTVLSGNLFAVPEMSLFNQMKLSVAKALQLSTDANIFEIPECAMLSTTDKISIKVANNTQMCILNDFKFYSVHC